MDRQVPKAKPKKNIKPIQNGSHSSIFHFADRK